MKRSNDPTVSPYIFTDTSLKKKKNLKNSEKTR